VGVERLEDGTALHLHHAYDVGPGVLDHLGGVLPGDVGEVGRLELDGPVPIGLAVRLDAHHRGPSPLEQLPPVFPDHDVVLQLP
jgi:hypothetical protein